MKCKKFILSFLFAVGAFASLGLTGVTKSNNAVETNAMNVQLYDEDMDVGLNVKASSSAAADWTVSSFFVNSFESVDVSQGNYIAFRMRSNNGGSSYFDFIPNVGGNASRVSLAPATGIKCVPAGVGGKAFDYGGARTWDLPLNFWKDADVWFCIPKSALSRTYFGSGINWNDPIWAIYFLFYGTTIDNVNFDIGNIWTVDIDGSGYLVKRNRICNWCNVEGAGYTGVDNIGRLDVTRNNPTLRNAVKVIQNIEYVDACDASAATTAYNATVNLYNSLDAAGKAYLSNYTIYDYAKGDTVHTGGRGTAWKASAKWAAIENITGHGLSSGRAVTYDVDKSSALPIIIAASVSVLSIAVLVLIKKRKAIQK